MRLVLPHTSPLDRHFLIESQGVGVVEGDTGTDPCYTLDAGTQGLEFSVRAVRPGIFRVKIIDVASGGWAMSQYSEVMGSGSVLTISSEPWQPDPESLPEEEQPWDPPTGESGDYPERECIPARSAPGTGPRLEGCTGCFKLTPGTPPPNPNCGSPTKGLFFPAKCIDSMDWYCEWDGTESIDATRYDYDGIMLLPCGSDTVEVTASYAPLGLGGGATWSSTTAKMQLCCVYKEVQNTTTKIKVKKCRSFL